MILVASIFSLIFAGRLWVQQVLLGAFLLVYNPIGPVLAANCVEKQRPHLATKVLCATVDRDLGYLAVTQGVSLQYLSRWLLSPSVVNRTNLFLWLVFPTKKD